MTGRLVVLGGCGAWPEPGRACSGFLVECEGFRVVLDLGYGTLPRLLTLLGSVSAAGVDAVVVTHEHPDHMVDLHGLFRARWFGARGAPPIPLYAPEKVLEHVGMLEALPLDAPALRAVFDWRPLPAEPYAIGPLVVESWLLPHYVPNAGVRLSADEMTLAYTGDTGPCAELTDSSAAMPTSTSSTPPTANKTRQRLPSPWTRPCSSLPVRRARPPQPPARVASCSPTSGQATIANSRAPMPARHSRVRYCSPTKDSLCPCHKPPGLEAPSPLLDKAGPSTSLPPYPVG